MLTDTELDVVQYFTGIWSIGHYQMMYGFLLERPVSREEASDALTRLTERHYLAHPEDRPAFEETYAALTRSPHTLWHGQYLHS